MTSEKTSDLLPFNREGQEFLSAYGAARKEISKDVIELDATVDGLMIALLGHGHAILEGEPGVGKTLLARTFNRIIDVKSTFVQFTPDMLPADLLYSMGAFADEEGGRTIRNIQFEKGPLFTKLFVGDEINRAMPKTTSVLLSPMEEYCLVLEGKEHKLGPLYFVTATQNPVESSESTNMLPEALRERFMLMLRVPYPTKDLLRKIAVHDTRPKSIKPCFTEAQIVHLQESILKQYVLTLNAEHPVVDYVANIILAIHDHPVRHWGPGIRAAMDLTQASGVHAFLSGRDHITFDDVKAMAESVLLFKFSRNSRKANMYTPPIRDNAEVIREVLSRVKIGGR